MTQAKQIFMFNDVISRPVPSILRSFSAPVKLITDLYDDDLRLLQLHDTDGFNKWEAGQILALRTIERVMVDKDADISVFVDDFGMMIQQGLTRKGNKALLARALSLPNVTDVAQTQAVIDPAAINYARTHILKSIKRTHKTALVMLYDANANIGNFAITPEAMGRRALQGVVLELLTISNGTGCATRSKVHYDNADNMTDRVAALVCLADSKKLERDIIFADFYERFKDYQLVVDKWFSLQAMANRKGIFDDFSTLRNHAEFNIKNPNRVRSLYSAFAVNNPVKFHDPSGKGYALLRNAIIELNMMNPQIAARLVTPLKEWKRYTPELQALMQAALQTIMDEPKLSNDVFEMVNKSLKG